MAERLNINVTAVNGHGDFQLCASHYKPQVKSRNAILFCLPGGGASAEFFDLSPDYNFANRMTAFGYDVITMDHPGTATNPLPKDHPFLMPRQSADYIHSAMTAITQRPHLKSKTLIGVGHSMGGMMISLIHGRHTCFKAIALLGSSAGGLEWGLSEDEKAYIDKPEELERDLEKLTLGKFKQEFIVNPGGGPSGKSITFGGETPELTQRLREISCELYSAGGMMSMTRGSFQKEVEAMDVPLFFAFGDHDIGIPPIEAQKAYVNATSTELLVLDNTGHNSLAFSSISTLCIRMNDWLKKIT
jgi:pimeloyl-ACP methyl ester carboxylesterase